jgi:hypothetical protein
MCKVASELGITVDSEKSQEVQYQSVSDHLSCDKQNNSSPRCRLPLDGIVLNALLSVDKEFVNKGTLRTFISLSPLSLLDWLRAKSENLGLVFRDILIIINLSNLRLTFEKVDVVVFAVRDTLVDTEVVVFDCEIKVADVAADLKRVGLRTS